MCILVMLKCIEKHQSCIKNALHFMNCFERNKKRIYMYIVHLLSVKIIFLAILHILFRVYAHWA